MSKWTSRFYGWIGLESNANEEAMWENSGYWENIVQGTGIIAHTMEVFQRQRFGLKKVNHKYPSRKFDGDFKYVPITEKIGIREIHITERQLQWKPPLFEQLIRYLEQYAPRNSIFLKFILRLLLILVQFTWRNVRFTWFVFIGHSYRPPFLKGGRGL